MAITNILDYKATNAADIGSRYYGYASGKNGNPYIKGYFQAFFELPKIVSASGTTDSSDNNAMVLTASMTGFTPHGDRTLNKTDIIGQGNVGASFINGQTITRTFSGTFQEKAGSPVWKIFKKWTTAIIDPYTGLSLLDTMDARLYKGRCLVVETLPVRLDAEANDEKIKKNILRVFYYDGVFPETDINSIFDSNVTAPDANVEINMSFSFDGYPLDDTNEKTLEKAVTYIKNAKLYDSLMKYYTNLYQTS